jgi:hypothetical protein
LFARKIAFGSHGEFAGLAIGSFFLGRSGVGEVLLVLPMYVLIFPYYYYYFDSHCLGGEDLLLPIM